MEQSRAGSNTEKELAAADTKQSRAGSTTEKELAAADTGQERAGTNPEKELAAADTGQSCAGSKTEKEFAAADTKQSRAGSKTEKERTAWHPLAFRAIKAFKPEGYEAIEEYSLSSLPRRIDIVVLEQTGVPAGEARGLNAIMERLSRYNLIEVKAPTGRLSSSALFTILGYAAQFMVLKKVRNPGEVTLFTLSDGIPRSFREQVGLCSGRLEQVRPGVWQVEGLLHRLYCIDALPASQTRGNHLLYLFCRQFLEEPGKIVSVLEPEELDVYSQMASHVVQLGRERCVVSYKGFAMLKKSMEEVAEAWMKKMPVELRLKGLPPEERLKGLRPEERLRGLPPEERLRGLCPEELEELRRLLDKEPGVRH